MSLSVKMTMLVTPIRYVIKLMYKDMDPYVIIHIVLVELENNVRFVLQQ